MRLFLREGERLKRREAAKRARLTRAAVWGSDEGFDEIISGLDD
jgi:hypothetical protein